MTSLEEIYDNIKVNILIAKEFNQEENSLINIIEEIDNCEKLSFYLYMTISFKREIHSDKKFAILFEIAKFDETEEMRAKGYRFARYNFELGDKMSSQSGEATNTKTKTQIDEKCIKSEFDKVISVKKIPELRLIGTGRYIILVSLTNYMDNDEKQLTKNKMILDSWQFNVV